MVLSVVCLLYMFIKLCNIICWNLLWEVVSWSICSMFKLLTLRVVSTKKCCAGAEKGEVAEVKLRPSVVTGIVKNEWNLCRQSDSLLDCLGLALRPCYTLVCSHKEKYLKVFVFFESFGRNINWNLVKNWGLEGSAEVWGVSRRAFSTMLARSWLVLAHVGAMLCILGSKMAAKMAILAIKNAKMSQDGAQEAAKLS